MRVEERQDRCGEVRLAPDDAGGEGWGLLHGRQEPAARSHTLLDNLLGYADLMPNDDLSIPRDFGNSYNLDDVLYFVPSFTLLATMRGNT